MSATNPEVDVDFHRIHSAIHEFREHLSDSAGATKRTTAPLPVLLSLCEELEAIFKPLKDHRLRFIAARLKTSARIAAKRAVTVLGPLRVLEDIAAHLSNIYPDHYPPPPMPNLDDLEEIEAFEPLSEPDLVPVPLPARAPETPPPALDASGEHDDDDLLSLISLDGELLEELTYDESADETYEESEDEISGELDISSLFDDMRDALEDSRRLAFNDLESDTKAAPSLEKLTSGGFERIPSSEVNTKLEETLSQSSPPNHDSFFPPPASKPQHHGFSPAPISAPKQRSIDVPEGALLPLANEVSFEDSGLLMIFIPNEAPPAADAGLELDIDVQPVEDTNPAELAVQELVDRLRRILSKLLDTLEIAYRERRPKEFILIARQLNRIARVLGLFELDEHLPMIAYLQARLPIEPEPWDPIQHPGPIKNIVNDELLAAFDGEELLGCMIALYGRLVEDIPQLERERYESTFLALYEQLGWVPQAPSANAPSRDGWQLMTELQTVLVHVENLLDEVFLGVTAALIGGHGEGYQHATHALLQIAEVMSNSDVNDVLLPLARLSSFLRQLRPTDAPADQVLSLVSELLFAMRPWFRDLPIDRFQQQLKKIHEEFQHTQTQRTGPLPRVNLPSAPPQRSTRHVPSAAVEQPFKHTSTSKMEIGALQLLAQLDALCKHSLQHLHSGANAPLKQRRGQLSVHSQQARAQGLLALVIALETLVQVIDAEAHGVNAAQLQKAALLRLSQHINLAMMYIERAELPSSPLRSVETYFLSNPEHHESARHVFAHQLRRSTHKVFAELRALDDKNPKTQQQTLEGLFNHLKRIADYSGITALQTALDEHQLASARPDADQAEAFLRLEQGIKAALPSAPSPYRASQLEAISAFLYQATSLQNKLRGVLDEHPTTPARPLPHHHPTITAAVNHLMPLAQRTLHLPFISVMCVLYEATREDTAGRHRLLARGLYWLERTLSQARLHGVTPTAPTPTPPTATPSPELEVVSFWPISKLQVAPRNEQMRRRTASNSITFQSRYNENDSLIGLAQRLGGRARALGKRIEISTTLPPRPILVGDDPEIAFILLSLEGIADALCSSFINHYWWRDDAAAAGGGQLKLKLERSHAHVSLKIEHNGRALTRALLQRHLQQAEISSPPSPSLRQLLEVFCLHSQALRRLPEGPALAVALAQLRPLHGALELDPSPQVMRLHLSIPHPSTALFAS